MRRFHWNLVRLVKALLSNCGSYWLVSFSFFLGFLLSFCSRSQKSAVPSSKKSVLKKKIIITNNYHSSRGVPLRGEQDSNETSSSVEEVPDRLETWQNLAVVKFLAQLRGTSHPISRSIRNYDAGKEKPF